MKWKNIAGFENYEISSNGIVRFLGGEQKRPGHSAWERPPCIVAQAPDKNGYLKVRLLKEGKRHKKSVHRLVAIHFIANPASKPEVNHKDGDKTNNKAGNLEWATRKENATHSTRTLKKNVGSANARAKLTEESARAIFNSRESHARLAFLYGVTPQAIGFIKRRETWRHATCDQEP